MGRTREFDVHDAVGAAARTFTTFGYEGTSVERLVEATGVHRGSLYAAFGSKLGLMLAALRDGPDVDLLLVALTELAPHDPHVRAACQFALESMPRTAQTLGEHLLTRAGIQGSNP